MSYTVYELAAFFFVYGFLGWVGEVAFAAVEKGKFINRGFLLGPICPIYGFGVVLVVWILKPFTAYPVVEYFLSVVICSLLELVTGIVLKVLFHERFWDYSNQKFNIGGYICLSFSALWGFACLIILYFVHPFIYMLIRKFPHILGIVFLSVFTAMILADVIITVVHALNIDKRMRMIEEISEKLSGMSDRLGKEISDKTIQIKERSEQSAAQRKELAEKYKALVEKHNIVHEHLFKSFANLKKGKYGAAYEKIRAHAEKRRNKKK